MAKKAENGVQFVFPPGQAASFDPAAFDDAIRSQGVELVHYRAMRCPVGLIDRDDSRRPHEDHAGCSNGNVYTEAGLITALFTGVTDEEKQNDVGFIDGSTVQVTAPRYYDNGEEVQVAPADRFYLKEEAVTVPHSQLAEAHVSGRDKLSFLIEDVVDVMDAKGKRYTDDDYFVENGQLVWRRGGPGFDAERDKGVIYAIRYTYRPYWYVARVLHQVRVAQIETQLERVVMRMPQQFVLQREIVFENEQKDDQAANPDSQRQVKGPRKGMFGPR